MDRSFLSHLDRWYPGRRVGQGAGRGCGGRVGGWCRDQVGAEGGNEGGKALSSGEARQGFAAAPESGGERWEGMRRQAAEGWRSVEAGGLRPSAALAARCCRIFWMTRGSGMCITTRARKSLGSAGAAAARGA